MDYTQPLKDPFEVVELTPNEVKALQICEETNALLEKVVGEEAIEGDRVEEEEKEVDDTVLEKALQSFKEALDVDQNCIEARLGIVYVCGLLGLFNEGLEELQAIEDLEIKDDRVIDFRAKLVAMMEADAELEKEQLEVTDGEEKDDGEEELEAKEKEEHTLNREEGREETAPTISKIVENGEVQPKFVAALNEIFKRFDKNNDGALDETELNALHLVTNLTPISPSEWKFFRQHFEVDRNRNLTLNGFVNFYISQALGDVDEVWKDLKALGYDNELALLTMKAVSK